MIKKILNALIPFNSKRKNKVRHKLQKNFLRECIYSHYDEKSLSEKRFYNIGAGAQRSQYNFWSYVDLKSKFYPQGGIDIFHDLESLKPLPLEENSAEIVFNSFLIEHLSIKATKNFCREAFRILKKGGVFHSKIHCYEYAFKLLKKGVFSHHIPFGCRESSGLIDAFINKHRGQVKAFFKANTYIIQSSLNPSEQISFSAGDAFLYHNVGATIHNLKNQPQSSDEILDSLKKHSTPSQFYENLKTYIDENKKEPHQHNADYFPNDELFAYIKSLGFSEVYFTQPYQSISPALWEAHLNPIYKGFTFSIEAVK